MDEYQFNKESDEFQEFIFKKFNDMYNEDIASFVNTCCIYDEDGNVLTEVHMGG